MQKQSKRTYYAVTPYGDRTLIRAYWFTHKPTEKEAPFPRVVHRLRAESLISVYRGSFGTVCKPEGDFRYWSDPRETIDAKAIAERIVNQIFFRFVDPPSRLETKLLLEIIEAEIKRSM